MVNGRTGALAVLLLASSLPVHAQGVSSPTRSTTSYRRQVWDSITGLPSNGVTGLVRSRSGYLWVGTAAGLVRFDGSRFAAFTLPGPHGGRYGTLIATADDAVWAKHERGQLIRVRRGRVELFDSTRGLTAPFDYTLTEDGSGRVWLTNGVGLFRVDGDRAVRERSPMAWQRVTTFLGRRDSTLYVVTGATDATGSGALSMRSATGVWSELVLPAVRGPTTITQLLEDSSGVMWLLSNDGIWSGRGSLRRVAQVPTDIPDSLEIVGTLRGAVIAHGARGFYRLTADSVTRMNVEGDSPVTRAWIADSSVWYASGNRVFRGAILAFRTEAPFGERTEDALQITAALRHADGDLWLGTSAGGLHRVQSRSAATVDAPTLTAGGAPWVTVDYVQSGDSALFPDSVGVHLAATQRDVEIVYAAPAFGEPNSVRFRYRLEGYDGDWVPAGSRRSAFYTKLPPGSYTFRVQGAWAGDPWGETSDALALIVLPRWWETPLFRGVLLLLGVAGGLMLVFRRVRVLRTQTQELQSVVADRSGTLREREQELAKQMTLLEEQARQLQALDSAKTRFFANVSHELRTPLTLTIGPLEDLQARGGRDAQEERWLEIALRNSRRLLRLVNQILDVAKLEAGQMQLKPRPLDLSLFVRGIIGAFASVAERKQIALTLEAPPVMKGLFDADAIEKVLTNLLSNAVKFTPNGGTVRLRMERSVRDAHATVTIRVIDTGPGIPPAQLANVFERFYQVDESDFRLQAGTGIGLALVKELVELQGGTITAESDPRGTMFTLDIPYGAVDEASARQPRADQVTGPTRIPLRPTLEQPIVFDNDENVDDAEDVPTMLVVDDSDDLRAYIRDHFCTQYRVLEAHDGAEGIAIAQRELPDIVISDIMMPGTDGISLVRALRESPETDFLAIVLLTAQAEDEKKITGLKSGADEYLVKPFDMRELDLRVGNLIAARRRWQDRFPRRDNNMGAPDTGDGGTVASTIVPIPHETPVAQPVAVLSALDEQFRERILAVIDARLSDQEFGVAELADAVAQDRSHLFRRVKQVFGTPPSNLLRERRLDAGARLLTTENGTVADVAYAVGFNSVSYFCQCFQRQFGETPATYRSRDGAGRR